MTPRARILVVEDEPQLRSLLRLYLEREGYEVTDAGDGRAALAAAGNGDFDLVVLDLMLPGMQGEAVLAELRELGEVPVLISSAKRSDAERIAGLRAGADDYLAKPFNPHELTARVAAILRRTRGSAEHRPPPILSLDGGRVVLDPASRRYTLRDGGDGRLTPGECSLLVALADHPGAVLGRQQLLDAVARRPDEVYERVVDVHVANLRRKLGDDAGDPWLIETVPATGYRLVASRDPEP
ncbi:MAG TPA: response regulator transcription factor [Candidatus Limnocylindria bacterium]|nr:response regulator transcription factor [Candidatus Limnocylindria bacterium]